MQLDWTKWPNFTENEFKCKCGVCGGEIEMQEHFLDKLQKVREIVGIPMHITSGYRCAAHPSEVKKPAGPGAHHEGVAADIACNSSMAYLLMRAAFQVGLSGVGVSQRAAKPRYVHLDASGSALRPNVWSY